MAKCKKKCNLAQRCSKADKLKPPSYETMMKWEDDGVAKAMDGCKVEPDGVCQHGCKSWLLVLGMI